MCPSSTVRQVDAEIRLLRECPYPLLVLDADDRILACSQELERRIGVGGGAWTGASLHDHVDVHSLAPTPDASGDPVGAVTLRTGAGDSLRARARATDHRIGDERLVILHLQLDEPTAPPREPAGEPGPGRQGGPGETVPEMPTILIVDDEPSVRGLAARCLARAGYRVLEAGGPAEAARIAGEHDGPIRLLISDVIMPGMSGVELSERITTRRPEMQTLYMTGYAREMEDGYGVPEIGPCLAKPFTPEDLVGATRRLLDQEGHGASTDS